MLTLDNLVAFGADIETGLKRCVNKESLYLRLVKMVPSNDGFVKLPQAIANKDYEAGFQAAHGLKGVVANLALEPLYEPIFEITEYLRAGKEMDYQPLLDIIEQKRSELAEICKD